MIRAVYGGGSTPPLNRKQPGKPLDKERGSNCRKACDYMLVPVDPQDEPGWVAPERLVLDTNVVLDWLWFADPRVDRIAAAVTGGLLHWTTTPAMRRELEIVLGRLTPRSSGGSIENALASFDRWSRPAPVAPVFERLRCSDGDDQKFIDLAVAIAATWLLSRDRAVLRLARRAAPFGLAIVVPEQWDQKAASAKRAGETTRATLVSPLFTSR